MAPLLAFKKVFAMPDMTASIPHQLTREEAKRRIQQHIDTLRQHHGLIISTLLATWHADRLDFTAGAMGQTISGHASVDDHMVHLTVSLPGLLGMLATTIKQSVEQQGRQLLGHTTQKNTQN